MTLAPEYDDRYLRGIDAFNRGDYFEAHEIWEDLWKDCPATDRLFYQSLIQAAVSLYHWKRKNAAGSMRLFAAGRDKMLGYRPRYLGLNVDDFWNRMTATLAGENSTPSIALRVSDSDC